MTSENSANSASPDPSSGSSSESSSDRSPHTFQVDLRGLVDLLSHHLYSSPRVYLRELLQNAVDAITARRAEQPDAPALVRLYASGGRLRIEAGEREDPLLVAVGPSVSEPGRAAGGARPSLP